MRLSPQTEIGGTTEWIRNLGPSGGENRINRSVFEALAERLQEVEISFFPPLFLTTLARVGTGFGGGGKDCVCRRRLAAVGWSRSRGLKSHDLV